LATARGEFDFFKHAIWKFKETLIQEEKRWLCYQSGLSRSILLADSLPLVARMADLSFGVYKCLRSAIYLELSAARSEFLLCSSLQILQLF
jgi:hypothetical protein